MPFWLSTDDLCMLQLDKGIIIAPPNDFIVNHTFK